MNRLTLCVALAAALGMGATLAHADSFTYHGTLQDSGRPANGSYDIQLTLYSSQSGGAQLAAPVTIYAVPVKNGNFSTAVDFGQMSTANAQSWVDVKVKPAGSGNFTALDNRSPVAPDGGCPGSWTLDGNAAIPSGSYLGTADANPVVIKTAGADAIYVETNQAVGLAYPYTPQGQYSIAGGYYAGTANAGSIVFADYDAVNRSGALYDSAPNQFIVGANGGVGIETSLAPDGNALRDELTIGISPALPAGNSDLTFETSTQADGYNGFNMGALPNGYFVINGLHDDANALSYDNLLYINYIHGTSSYGYWQLNGAAANGIFTVGHDGSSGNGAYLTAGGVWTNASSRTFKEAFEHVNVTDVLSKLVSLPVQTWFYKDAHQEGRHMGPVAEEFMETFGLGNDDKHITTVDESGIALAAIQGLNKKVEVENASLKQENVELRGKLDAIVARLDKLESNKGE